MEKDKPEIPMLNLAQQQAVMSPILQYNRLLTFQNHLNHLALSLTVPTVPTAPQAVQLIPAVQQAQATMSTAVQHRSKSEGNLGPGNLGPFTVKILR